MENHLVYSIGAASPMEYTHSFDVRAINVYVAHCITYKFPE